MIESMKISLRAANDLADSNYATPKYKSSIYCYTSLFSSSILKETMTFSSILMFETTYAVRKY
jgi:hypothetical protein